MKLHLGIKSDTVQYRFSYEWLFGLMRSLGVVYLQLGGFSEMPFLEDGYYHDLRDTAERYGIRIKSLYPRYRVTAGFFTTNPHLEKAARRIYEIYIHAGAVLGVDYVGANAGVLYQDHPEYREQGIGCYLSHIRELMQLAKESGIRGLTIETMSSLHEWPTTPEETRWLACELGEYHERHAESTTPFYILGDVSHGFVNREGDEVHSNYEIFESAIPYMCEFHFKNTDSIFNSTFGFSDEEREMGVVDLKKIKKIIYGNEALWPVEELVGYLEIPGPKFGRDYSDPFLETQLTSSIEGLHQYFPPS
jgi:hypothetical protein